MRFIKLRFTYFVSWKNHNKPKIAAKDNWKPACIIKNGFIKNNTRKAKAALRKDKIFRPNIHAIKIKVVIKNARVVATLIPEIHK